MRTESNNSTSVGAYTATMLSAKFTSPKSNRHSTILDTGAAGISYFKDYSFLDPAASESLTKLFRSQGLHAIV